MERWLSWSKAHDWKSCVPYKGTEGSNPSLSAKKKFRFGTSFFILMKKVDWFDIKILRKILTVYGNNVVRPHTNMRTQQKASKAPIVFILKCHRGVVPIFPQTFIFPYTHKIKRQLGNKLPFFTWFKNITTVHPAFVLVCAGSFRS